MTTVEQSGRIYQLNMNWIAKLKPATLANAVKLLEASVAGQVLANLDMVSYECEAGYSFEASDFCDGSSVVMLWQGRPEAIEDLNELDDYAFIHGGTFNALTCGHYEIHPDGSMGINSRWAETILRAVTERQVPNSLAKASAEGWHTEFFM